MFLGVSLTLGAAVMAGALATNAGRDFILGKIDQDWLADELDFDALDTDLETVCLKSGAFMRVFAIRGLAFETMSIDQELVYAKRRSQLLHQHFKHGTNIRFFGVKRTKDVSFDAEWPSSTLKEIGEAEKELYKKAFYISWYMVVSSSNRGDLHETSKALISGFADHEIRSVRASDVDQQPCELTSFLNYLVTGDLRDDLPRKSSNLSAALPSSDIKVDTSGLITTNTPTEHYHKIISVKEWPEALSGALISRILALPAEIEVSQVCLPLHTEKTIAALTRKINEQENNFFGDRTTLAELVNAKEHLVSDSKTLFETQFQVVVRSKSLTDLDEAVEKIAVILTQSRVSYSVATSGGAVCWFNRLPEKSQLLRPLRLYNDNISSLWTFQFSPEGMYSSPFGPLPVRLFKTPTGQNYAFQFHVSDRPQSAGNYLVLAPTGTGKSTLIMHLLSGFAKFPQVRNYVFDSKEGARFMIEGMGGLYQGYDDLSLNPLDTNLSTKSGLHRAHMVLRAMVGNAYTEEMDTDIKNVLKLAAKLDTPERTFNEIYSAGFPAKSELKKAFLKWVETPRHGAGQYSHIFNSGFDNIKSFLEKSYLVGINMNEALEDKVLGPAIIAHISAAISEAARGNDNGFTIFVDEAANLLQNKGFRDVVLQMYREYRKLDGLVGLAFQDPEALLKFEDAEGIIKNTQTLLFMPNAQATEESLAPFNLTSDQVAFIRGESQLAAGRQVLVVKRDLSRGYDESAIIDVDLSSLGDALRFYRAGTSANADLQKLKDTWGAEWLSKI